MSSIQNLCILRLSAIGDVCHAAAMVTRIRDTKPDIQITWIIGKVEYQLMQDMPGVEFIVFDKSLGKAAFADLKQKLSGRSFDALFVMQVAFRANWAARLIKARQRIGFDWQRSKELHWLFANKRIAAQTHGHVLEGFMAFADAIGIPATEGLNWHMPLDEADRQWAKEQKRVLGDYVVISPAASKAERNWLPERYAQVADYLAGKGKSVILCGGPGALDREIGDKILSQTQAIAQNYIAKTTLKQLLALLAESDLVIAPDTGPAHMATTIATPVIGLYAHSNPRRTGPYLNQDNVVSVYDEVILEQQGKPWQALPWGTRAKGKDLMARIEVTAVTAQIDKLI